MAAWHEQRDRRDAEWVAAMLGHTRPARDRESEQRDSLNLWHGIMEREPRKPGLSRKAWLGIAFGLYLSFMLGLAGWVLWKIAHPLPHLIP